MKIYLLTHDAENRRKALSEQLDAMSVQVRSSLLVVKQTLVIINSSSDDNNNSGSNK